HTTMINAIGVVGWGVGGIEAEAGMLGQPVYFLTPDVVGVELKGKLGEGITATDLVLTVTEMLRKEKVVGKFVEFLGEGTASLAGPKGTQDRIEMGGRRSTCTRPYSASVAENGFGQAADKLLRRYSTKPAKPGDGVIPDSTMTLHGAAAPRDVVEMVNNRPTPDRVTSTTGTLGDIGNGDVLIAAITSCTNTSNPSVLLAAGLLAKKAVEKGLAVKPGIKT